MDLDNDLQKPAWRFFGEPPAYSFTHVDCEEFSPGTIGTFLALPRLSVCSKLRFWFRKQTKVQDRRGSLPSIG